MSKKIDLTGQIFGRLKIQKEAGKDRNGRTLWECQCNCGNIKIIVGKSLRNGNTKSCGCLGREVSKTHGMSKTPTYYSWLSMKARCGNKNHNKFADYGGRGITVCYRWQNSFETFLEDMGERPIKLTIERRNNNLGYFKENCYWASRTIQSRNQRLPKTNRTGAVGINWYKPSKKYLVRITANNKQYSIGYFNTLEQAKIARKQAEQKYWK